MKRVRILAGWLIGSLLVFLSSREANGDSWHIGFGRVEVTPTEPVRLSGYAVRKESHQGVADPLHARAMVISPIDPSQEKQSVVMVSIDSIAVTSAMTVELAEWLDREYGIPRSQLAMCSTHSHAAPHVDGGLLNLFREPSSDEQIAATQAYTRKMIEAVQKAIILAMEQRTRGNLSIGEATVRFAVNRRLLKEGIWSGFGVQADGQVDHRLRVMRAVSEEGELLGCFFLYACHCTTLDSNFNRISGDWAGLAAIRLETMYPGAIFLPIIGCGADANPNPRGTYEFAQQHAAEMVDAVEKVLKDEQLVPVESFPVARFGYAGLAPEQPSDELLSQMLVSNQANERRWAQEMNRIRKEMGRLPETYPMPIHTWQFGELLTCVFLGGEVVVDYQFRIEKELSTQQTWVAAYTDDVFAYVASEKMREEKGYEVDFSMIYYLQPGRWQHGTQSLVVRRVAEIWKNQLTEAPPLSATEALESIRVADGFRVELVASEPLVQDPINLAFGADGRVWVVEMADYPLGSNGGGRIKWLRDTDGDGKLDQANLFLSGLSYPTSVFPWKEGALIIAAPDVIYAADSDGDGVAEIRQTLLTGLEEANPQHRATGFELGLDGWLHFGVGSGTRVLKSLKTEISLDVHRRDVAWNPQTGELRTTSGETQFVRSRDAFGNWFGNSNSEPIYQFVIEDRYLRLGSSVGEARRHLLSPPTAPPVFPRSQTMDRFNDLHTLNRFTSACSSTIARVPGVAGENESIGFICEPVHNLVARIRLEEAGSTFSATRHPDDDRFDFFASSDGWSRPVRAINAPDGTLWIVDMVRKVIEHPEWIPTSWQQRLDLRAGANLGRIYRVARSDFPLARLPVIDDRAEAILEALASENGAVRDLALTKILLYPEASLAEPTRDLAHRHPSAGVRVSALGALAARGWLDSVDLEKRLEDPDRRVVRYALELAESIPVSPTLHRRLLELPFKDLGQLVDLQWILTSLYLGGESSGAGYCEIARRSEGDVWIERALSLVQDPHIARQLVELHLKWLEAKEAVTSESFARVLHLLVPLWKRIAVGERRELVRVAFESEASVKHDSQFAARLLLLTLVSKHQEFGDDERVVLFAKRVREQMVDSRSSEFERIRAIGLLGTGCFSAESELAAVRRLLLEDQPETIRTGTLEAIGRMVSDELGSIVLDGWNRYSESQRRTACLALLNRTAWTRGLLARLESGQISLQAIEPSISQPLLNHRDRVVRSRAIALFGKPTPRTEVVERYLATMPSPFNDGTGEGLYQTLCAACHRPQLGLAKIAPPLENLQHWTLEQWVTAILDPNRNVEAKYLQSSVLTHSDHVFQGIVMERTPSRLRLAQADGTLREIPSSEIADVKATKVSLMPEGFESRLTPENLARLIQYLRQSHGQNPIKNEGTELPVRGDAP